MTNSNPQLTTCLWFDGQALEAATYYTSVFPNSHITQTAYYTAAGQEQHRHEPGSIMSVYFSLNGNQFLALNGGPEFKFSEAVSFQIECENQAEVDYYFEKMGEGGDETKRECGWLADKWGVSWQIVPKQLTRYILEGTEEQKERVMSAMMKMKKMDIETLTKAFEGVE